MVLPLIALVGGLMVYRPEIISKNLDAIGRSLIVLMVIGYIWDAYAVYEGWWFYETGQIVDIWILGLPLEEHLFILTTSLFYILLTLTAMELWGDERR